MAGLRKTTTTLLSSFPQLGRFIASSMRLMATLQEEAKSTVEQVKEKTNEVANKVSEKVQDVSEKAKQATRDMNERTKEKAQDMNKKAKEITQDMNEKTKEKTQDVGERAKQTTQDAWGSTKETAQNVKGTVEDKIEESETLKRVVDSNTLAGKSTEKVVLKTAEIATEAAIGKFPKIVIEEGVKIIKDVSQKS